jgi:glucosamine--fructose-6-phosphate aminotransferase (isomerizing)
MIMAQADALDRIAELDLAAPAGILAAARRVIIVGTGTSQHAAELGVMMLERAGRDARWFPASTWVRWGGARPGDALVLITHTGKTGYAAAWADALASGVPVVSINGTGAPAGGYRDRVAEEPRLTR